MGHTLPPFSQQFKLERALFNEMRRALLRRADKVHFDALWDKAEFHVPAAEKAKHPLPITSILLSMNLEQEKTIAQLAEQAQAQRERIRALEAAFDALRSENLRLRREIEMLLDDTEHLRKSLRTELLEILYPSDAL